MALLVIRCTVQYAVQAASEMTYVKVQAQCQLKVGLQSEAVDAAKVWCTLPWLVWVAVPAGSVIA